jgi:hypothetical protein
MINRGPGILAVVCFGSHPDPFPLSQLLARPATHFGRLRKRDTLLKGEGWKGVREEPNAIVDFIPQSPVRDYEFEYWRSLYFVR